MLFTPEQFLLLGAVLLGGWLLGYASAPSAGKWKRRLKAQSERFAAYHADTKDRARAANQRATDLQSELEAVRADHAEAERTIAGLRGASAAPVAALVAEHAAPEAVEPAPIPEMTEPVQAEIETETASETAPEPEPEPEPELPEAEPAAAEVLTEPAEPMTPTATEAPPAPIGPADPEPPRTGWFASSARDPLTRIRGIDDALNARLFELGVVRFEDIEMLSGEDELALEQRLALPAGTILADQWRTQAALLRGGQDEEHAAHLVPTEPAPLA